MAGNRSTGREVRWRSRPILSGAIRVAAVVIPAAAAVLAAIALSRALPPPVNSLAAVAWWVLFLATTLATWLVCASLLQKLLPLAALLDLTLLFPDAAPSRFAVLRRQANPHHLEDQLRRLQAMGPDDEQGRRAQVILELAAALSVHDSRTRGHSERVRMFTDLLAQQLRLRQNDADRLRWAALLHDIGKLAVAPEILNKPGSPADDEWEALHQHPLEGFRLIAPLHAWLGIWADTVRDHHERFDGTGYPNRLRGLAISLGGRIVAVTDSYETMTAARPYKSPMSVAAAREELVQMSGSHFDPEIVRAFLAISLGRLWQAVGLGAVVAQLPILAPVSWHLSRLGQRSASAIAATAATGILIVVGIVGPGNPVYPYGSVLAGLPPVSNPTQSTSPKPPAPAPQSPPPSAPSAPSSTAAGVGPNTGQPAGAATSPSGTTAAASYPAGISKHSIPFGISKNPSAFTRWRSHH